MTRFALEEAHQGKTGIELVQKFPNTVITIGRYLEGETLIEAYWKSVAMPGQGIFIGEPLAAPFRPQAAGR